ncbi:beta-phosphoglucomutase [Paenibacillus sp.]|uniref:beta-phosphoglucomutase n=1 Tax=Paenibacillus sp. TaxID=58172 RepID=UPI002810B582|nr:beta-phosphoglucomutase [Paenibacillus sp.]
MGGTRTTNGDFKPKYAYDEWSVVEDGWDEATNLVDETIFSLGNGYLGMRGNLEEGFRGAEGRSTRGTYINAFYETEPIRYPEDAYGYARVGQTMLNVADARGIELYVDGERVDLFACKLLDYKRTLDFRRGTLVRTMRLELSNGNQVDVRIERLVSLTRKHVAAIRYEVTTVDFHGLIGLVSTIDGAVRNQVSKGDPRLGSALTEPALTTIDRAAVGTLAFLHQRTKRSGFTVMCAAEHQLQAEEAAAIQAETSADGAAIRFSFASPLGVPATLTKTIAYHTSKEDPGTLDERKLRLKAEQTVQRAKTDGFDALLEEQRAFLERFWERTDVTIEGDPALQQGVRFNAFQLLQSVGRDGETNISAKGLTGEGYEGHYFWDTETYILPFFLYTNPDIAKQLLTYRYGILDKARERARTMSQKGALFAWRTIGGEETSAYFPAGTAQVHINADIAYALKKYMAATEDDEFLIDKGAELLFETARLWADLGDYIPHKGFCINGVTGPDEYTALVNNNAFTNVMAKDHLEYAAATARRLRSERTDAYRDIASRIALDDAEVDAWQRAAERMYVPYDAGLGVTLQDDAFLDRAEWDFANAPADKYPLLLHYHPLVIYRHRVLKQADVVLASFLQSDRFSLAQKRRDYEFYERLTTHDSSLSPCIYSIVAAEIGKIDRAYDYFLRTARMDLDDRNGNAKDGLHTAAMAGTWLSLANGFGGMREQDGKLRFRPSIPARWTAYAFVVAFRGRRLRVRVTPDDATYSLLEGDDLTIEHEGRELRLASGRPAVVSMRRKLEAVIFDLDGVIVDTASFHYECWKRIADEQGVPLDPSVNERVKGVDRRTSLDIVLERASRPYSEEEKAALANRKNELYVERIEQLTPEALLPGIEAFLRDVKSRGLKTAIASASRNARLVVERLGVGAYFDAIVDAGSVAKGKPDPEIFFAAAEALGVPYRNCAAIEDAEAGIAAIRAAGMFAVGVGTEARMRGADWLLPVTEMLALDELSDRFSGSPPAPKRDDEPKPEPVGAQ